MFLKEVSYVHQHLHLFDDKRSKNSKIVKYYYSLKSILYFNLFLNVLYLCEGKVEFSAALLQSSVSRDPSEINLICWFASQETFFHYQC